MWELRSLSNQHDDDVFIYQIVNKLPISESSLSDIKVVAYQKQIFPSNFRFLTREDLMSESFMHSNTSSTLSLQGVVNILSIFNVSVQDIEVCLNLQKFLYLTLLM